MVELDKVKLIPFLQDKWKNRPCPMCQSTAWNVHESPWQVTKYEGRTLTLGGAVLPLIAVICRNCGNTVFVNAVTTGMLIGEEGQQ